jgi:hypothetical protein
MRRHDMPGSPATEVIGIRTVKLELRSSPDSRETHEILLQGVLHIDSVSACVIGMEATSCTIDRSRPRVRVLLPGMPWPV